MRVQYSKGASSHRYKLVSGKNKNKTSSPPPSSTTCPSESKQDTKRAHIRTCTTFEKTEKRQRQKKEPPKLHLKVFGRDGEPVASRQLENLVLASETGSHHDRFVTVLLVVTVDLRHTHAPGVLFRRVCLSRLLLVEVQDAAHERRDEGGPCLRTRRRL